MKKIVAFIMNINLNPKVIVTSLFKGLSNADFLKKVKSMEKAAEDHSSDVPSLDPPQADVKADIVILDDLMVKEENILLDLKSNTEKIVNQRKKITNTFNDDWKGQVQKDCAGDVEKIKQLGWGVKGYDDQQGEPLVTIKNSHPSIEEVDMNKHLEITITIHNSVTGKLAVPDDAKGTRVYIYIGDTEPTLKQMHDQGAARRGKFTIHFSEDELGQSVWIACMYEAKASADGEAELSPKVRRSVI